MFVHIQLLVSQKWGPLLTNTCSPNSNSLLTLCFPLSLQDNIKTTTELSRILESTRDHLESQLNRAEAEKAHLAAQIQARGHKTQTFHLTMSVIHSGIYRRVRETLFHLEPGL